MSQNARAISFISKHLKYKASKRLVAGLSGAALSVLWRKINETEISGMRHEIYCGRIDLDILRSAFSREISYNHRRFCNSSSKNIEKIVNDIRGVLARFAQVWPNGINGFVYVIDTTDPQYKLLRDIRDCFKAIARQNMADLKIVEYRDEIIAMFAADSQISMSPDMRALLRSIADKTAFPRAVRRDVCLINDRIAMLEKQMKLNVIHDRELYRELVAERDTLKRQLDSLMTDSGQQKKKINVAVSCDKMDDLADDAAEREQELLSTLTPEHTVDETFQEYAKRVAGLSVARAMDCNHR